MAKTFISMSEKIIKMGYLLLLFSTPLVISPNTNELFEFPKMHFVYALTLIIFSSFLIKSILTSKITIPKTPINKPIFLFIIFYLLSLIFSLDIYTSLFGYYTRFNGGLISLVCYIILFFVYIAEFSNQKFPVINLPAGKPGFQFSILLSSFIVSVYAILQHVGIDKNLWVQDSQARVFSTLGQPNWLAAFLVMTFPIGLSLMFLSEKKFNKIFFLSVLFFLLSAFWFTYSLSGLLGFSLSLLIFFVLLPKKYLHANKKLLTTLLLFLLLIATFKPGIFSYKLHDVYQNIKKSFGVVALAKPGTGLYPARGNDLKVSDTTSIRINVWKGAIRSISSSGKTLLVGNGPETFAYSFLPFRPKELNLTSEWDFLFNKAHNDFLEKAANLGPLGLGSYLFLIFSFIFWIKKVIGGLRTGSREADKEIVLLTGLLSGFTALLITDIFGWQTVTTNLYFWIFMAIAVATSEGGKQRAESQNKNTGYQDIKLSIPKILLIIIVLIFSLFAFRFTIRLYRADILYNKGLSTGNVELIQDAIKLNPWEPTYPRELARIYSTFGQEDKFLYEANEAFRLNPKNMLTIKSLIGSYSLMAVHNADYLYSAIELAKYGSKLSPNDAKLKLILANLYYIIEDNESAIRYVRFAIELKPNYQEAKDLLGKL